MSPRLEAHGVTVERAGKEVLRGIDIDIAAGECVGIAGPNAAGKSTLLRAFAGELPLKAGEIRVEGRPVIAGRIPAEVGIATQEVTYFPNLSARENLRFFGSLEDLGGRRLGQRVDELLTTFDLRPWADQRSSRYSGGIGRRLHLALAMLNRPSILLLDEPTVGLDPPSRKALLEVILDLVADGTSVVITSQILNDLEVVASRLVVIVGGVIKIDEGTRDLMSRLGSAEITIELARHAGVHLDLSALPAVTSWQMQDTILEAKVSDSPRALPEILALLASADLRPVSIEVQPPTLDQLLSEIVSESGKVVG